MKPEDVRVEVLGGDAYGRGDQPALSWRLPLGSGAQQAYQIVMDDGFDSGVVKSAQQTFVVVPVFDRSRRSTEARLRVWTDVGDSDWSDAVTINSGLLEESDWAAATWIGVDEAAVAEKGSRPAYWLRTVFDAAEAEHVVLHATALGLYEAFLNGVRVGRDELTPGYTQYAQRVQYQAYDVGSLVRPGRNVLAVLLADGWYRGQVGMPRAADQFGPATALRLLVETRQGNDWQAVAGTSTSWRTSISHVLAADLIGGQREDRRLLKPTLHTVGFDDSQWRTAVVREPQVAIVRPMAPPVRRLEKLRPRSVTPLDDEAYIVDLGQNINGWLRLTNLGHSGTTITIRHGEHLDRSGDLDTGHLDVDVPILPEPLPVGQVDVVTSAGREEDVFEPRFATKGFRYARIEGHLGPLAVEDVTGMVVHSDLRRTGWFECSDERLNRLHEAVVWSLRGNVCDIPTDCPQRERAGWTGDWQIFAPTAVFLYDVLAFTRKWLRDVQLDQRDDGCVANMSPCPPSEGFAGPLGALNGSAGWGDVVVSAPWDLYQAYGDLSLLRENWSAMRRWVDFAADRAASQRHPERAAQRPVPKPHERYLWDVGFHWGEWLEPGMDPTDFQAFAQADKSEVATAYLHRSATTLVQTGELLGVEDSVLSVYRSLAAGVRKAWRAEFLADDGSLRVRTQAGWVRALAFGLLEPAEIGQVAAALVDLVREAGNHVGTGFLSTGLLLPTLADAGHVDVAYDLLLQDTEPSWLTMLDRGATTMWERWNGVDADGNAHESLNHYSKGAVISFLHRYVVGLQPTSPGYRTFRVGPLPGGGLTSAGVVLDCPYGRIEAAWRLQDGEVALDILVPSGTSAEVLLPGQGSMTVGPGRHMWPADRLPT